MYRYALEGFIDLYGFDPRNYLYEDELSDIAKKIVEHYIGEDGVDETGRRLVEYAVAAQYNAYLGIVILSTKKMNMRLQDIVDELYREGRREDERYETRLYMLISASTVKSAVRLIEEKGDNEKTWDMIQYLVLIIGLYIAREMKEYYDIMVEKMRENKNAF